MDKWFENTTIVRITALVLGLLLYVVVHMDEHKTPGNTLPTIQTETITNASITRVGLDESQFTVQSVEPSEVILKVSGKQSALNRLNPEDYKIELDLSNVKEGVHPIILRGTVLVSGVEIVEIIPSHVTVRVEAMQRKEMPVDIIVKGQPAVGFKAGAPVIQPSKVHVLVPKSSVNSIVQVSGVVKLDGESKALSKEVKLQAFDDEGRMVQAIITPSVVEVEIPITSPVKTVPLQVKLVGKMPQGYSIEKLKPNVEQVTVYGPQSYLDHLEFYNGLEIDLSKLELTQSQKITLAIPIQGETEKVEPALVEYEVTVVPSSKRTFTNVPITFIGVNDDYSTKVIVPAPGDIDVIVEGAPSVLNNLKPQDVQVIVDVSDLPPGVHSLQVSLNLPSLLQASNRFTKTVQVEIKAKDVSTDGSVPAVTEEHTGNDGMGQKEPSPDGSSDGDEPVPDVPAVPEGSNNAGGNTGGT